MKKPIVWWSLLGCLVVGGVLMAIPDTRYPILGFLHIERLCHGRPIGHWVAELNSNDVDRRRRAAFYLGDAEIEDDEEEEEGEECESMVAALAFALADSDSLVRKNAASSFLLSPRDTKVPDDVSSALRLATALRDDQAAVRQAAVRALWQAGPRIKDAGVVSALTAALSDPDEFVRTYATRALTKIGPDARDAVPSLLARLQSDDDRDVRKLAAKALGKIGAEAIGASFPEVVSALKKSLKEEPRGLREYAARSLGELGAKKAIPALQQATRDGDPQVRAAAVAALKQLGAK